VKRVASRDNPQFRRLKLLARSSQARRTRGELLLDGTHLLEAYAAAYGAGRLQVVLRASGPGWAGARVPGAPEPIVLADALFDEIAPVATPTGVLAIAPIPLPGTVTPGTRAAACCAFLDGVQDPGNLGAILRSAAAAGLGEAYLSAGCADPWSPKALRGGMGAQFRLAINDRADLPACARAFDGRLIAADSAGGRSLFEADLTGRIGFILGAEGLGIAPPLLAIASERVRIPMAEGMESLNVAAAATLLFYEWRRREAAETE
jgi:TrmH family RNA methyltransferase